MAPTIKDVALRAGVSPITASRAFSGTHPVASQTRAKVFEAAEEIGYSPNLLARALVHKKSPMIGVIVPDLSNPFFSPVIDAIQAVAQQHQHLVIIYQSQLQVEVELVGLSQFRQLHVAGILPMPVAENLDYLKQYKTPTTSLVIAARQWDEGDYVNLDYYAGGHLAGQHLVGLGHRKIGCITFQPWQPRIHGFKQALVDGGVELLPEWLILTETARVANGIQAADTFLSLPNRPTAVFIASDQLSIGFVHRVRERGLRVPDDVAVVSYDDIRYAEFFEVPLTTVALPKYEMGQRAAQILFERIHTGNVITEPYQVTLKPELIVRTSCGALSSPRLRPG